MSELIQDNEGTIDKYIGDAIMAIWNAPRAVYAHEVKACESALLYQSRLDKANAGTCDRGHREGHAWGGELMMKIHLGPGQRGRSAASLASRRGSVSIRARPLSATLGPMSA
jgi:class 3 adenylate cyclase